MKYIDLCTQLDERAVFARIGDAIHFEKAAAALTALSAERDALAVKIAEYEAHDGMHGAIVHAIRSLLNESNVPGAAFIDDHVANAIVQRDALTAQVAELTRERDEWRTAYHKTHEAFSDADAARDAAEAEVARLEGALRGLLSAVDAWAETPPRSDAEMEASFPVYAAAETARAALTEGTQDE